MDHIPCADHRTRRELRSYSHCPNGLCRIHRDGAAVLRPVRGRGSAPVGRKEDNHARTAVADRHLQSRFVGPRPEAEPRRSSGGRHDVQWSGRTGTGVVVRIAVISGCQPVRPCDKRIGKKSGGPERIQVGRTKQFRAVVESYGASGCRPVQWAGNLGG